MHWSFSEGATFSRCPRQWYYKYCVASARAKKPPIRREAFLLSKLDSIWAWRGKIVDNIISTYIVPALQAGRHTDVSTCLKRAHDVFERQLSFGLENRLREPGLVISHLGDNFAAFHAVEYGSGLAQQQIEQAWSEIERALTNLFARKDLFLLLRQASRLIVQRSLYFSLDLPVYGVVSVRATPDLIIFNNNRPPIIIDWKVKSFAAPDYRVQLMVYALALCRCQPHRDFPVECSQYDPQQLGLFEIHLLQDSMREYQLTLDDLSNMEEFIFESVSKICRIVGSKGLEELNADEFPPTSYPNVCESCGFRRICWED